MFLSVPVSCWNALTRLSILSAFEELCLMQTRNVSDNGLKTSKIDSFSPLYELESALQCALEAIEVSESQDEK
jgi:hypothetical protein